MTLMLSLYDAISSTLMILSRSSSEFKNLIFLYSFFSYTCLESVYRICICLLCASYSIFYSKSREYFLHCYCLFGKSYSSVIGNHEQGIFGGLIFIFCRRMLLKRIREGRSFQLDNRPLCCFTCLGKSSGTFSPRKVHFSCMLLL